MPWSFLSSRTGAGTSVGTLPRGRPGCPLLGLHASSFASFTCRHPRENFLLEPSHRPGQVCEASRRGSLQQPRRGPQGSCPFSAADWRTHWPCLARELLPGLLREALLLRACLGPRCGLLLAWRPLGTREPAEGKGESGLLIQPPDTPSTVHLHSFATTAHRRPVA